jgi:hypothetical protein
MRSTRLLLELHAGSPVILLPVSSQSPEILVVDLGKLSVNNSFCYAGSKGTISAMRQQAEFEKHSREASSERPQSSDDIYHGNYIISIICLNPVSEHLNEHGSD